jgi:hypothetical protein
MPDDLFKEFVLDQLGASSQMKKQPPLLEAVALSGFDIYGFTFTPVGASGGRAGSIVWLEKPIFYVLT